MGEPTIGINGPWGSGKTSFANMIKEQIDKKNRIIIDFNPWRSSSASRIIEDFFELLIAELKPHDPDLSTSITSYAKSLTKIEENIITRTTESLSELLFEELNKNEAFDKINNSIKKVKRQIIVFIDDLDRLDKKEIIEVLRIIRNTANFNNIVYIVSYDKGYVQTAIKDYNPFNYKTFLEKIFQFEFTLPMYEHGVLRTEIKYLLKENLEKRFHAQIDRVVESNEFSSINFTNEIVKTYRDVIRLINSLLFEIEGVKDEIYLYDFYLLQLLKLKFPLIYESLINNKHIFFKADGEKGLYRFKTMKEVWISDDVLSFTRLFNKTNKHNYDEKSEPEFNIDEYLKELKNDLELTEYEKGLIKHMLDTLILFKETKEGEKDVDLYKSFAYPSNFHKYFAFRLYEGDISAKEFEDFRRREFNEYRIKVAEWIEQGKYSILIDRLEKIEDFSSTKEFENHIFILFEIGRLQIADKKNNLYWIDVSLTIKNLKYPKPHEKVLRVYSDADEYREFLFKLFDSAPAPQLYESLVIARIIATQTKIELSFSELSDINLKYFKDYCKIHNRITTEFSQLHNHAIRIKDQLLQTIEVVPEAEAIYLHYFKTNLQAYELNTFIRQSSPGHEYYNIDKDWLFKIFESWEKFELYLEELALKFTDSDYYKEFITFYSETKNHDYSPVEYNFQKLKISRYE